MDLSYLSETKSVYFSNHRRVDVIESFFHVTIWAIFHNFYTVKGTLLYREKTIKTLLRTKNEREMGPGWVLGNGSGCSVTARDGDVADYAE